MEHLIWFFIMALCGAVFTALGVFAWNRKKPMWFWSGSTVRETEISDIAAYNHANGVMWVTFSLVFWLSAFAGFWSATAAVVLAVAGCAIGLPLLVVVYGRIYAKFKA